LVGLGRENDLRDCVVVSEREIKKLKLGFFISRSDRIFKLNDLTREKVMS
jgi:hypothetical protein